MVKFTLYGYPDKKDMPDKEMHLESFCGIPKPGISSELPNEMLEFYIDNVKWLYRGRAETSYRLYIPNGHGLERFIADADHLQVHADFIEEKNNKPDWISMVGREEYLCRIKGMRVNGFPREFKIDKKTGSPTAGSGLAFVMPDKKIHKFRVIGVERPFIIENAGRIDGREIYTGYRTALINVEEI